MLLCLRPRVCFTSARRRLASSLRTTTPHHVMTDNADEEVIVVPLKGNDNDEASSSCFGHRVIEVPHRVDPQQLHQQGSSSSNAVTLAMPTPVPQTRTRTLYRGSYAYQIRTLEGLPDQAAVRKQLVRNHALVCKVLAATGSPPLNVGGDDDEDGPRQGLAAIEEMLMRVVREDTARYQLGVGFVSVLRSVMAHIDLLNNATSRRTTILTARKRRKTVDSVLAKLPGLVHQLQLAVSIHVLVDRLDSGETRSSNASSSSSSSGSSGSNVAAINSPFVTAAQESGLTRDAYLRTFNAAPFFASYAPHLMPSLASFHYMLVRATAAASKAYSARWRLVRLSSFAFYNAYYALSIQQAARRAAKVLNDDDFDMGLCKFLWNLADSSALDMLFDKVTVDLPFSIPNELDKPNSQFYERSTAPPADLAHVLKVPRLTKTSPHYRPLIRVRLTSAHTEPLLISTQDHPEATPKVKMSKFALPPSASSDDLAENAHAALERHTGGIFGHFSLKYPILSNPAPALIVHVHGGGFVAMTSYSHLPYVRKWSIDTDMPVFSVDYRLAPEYAFPTQLEECYQAYRWVVANALRVGSTGQRIILAGDSAGGNLVAAVTLMAIAEGFRVPDGLLLSYPVLNLTDSLSCSRILSSTDPMLNTGMLMHLKKLLRPTASDFDPNSEPFMSPVFAPDEALRRFPPTRIVVGEFDPLLDDSVMFYNRLKAIDHDVEISIRPGLGHGFLQLVNLAPEVHEEVGLTSLYLRDLCGLG